MKAPLITVGGVLIAGVLSLQADTPAADLPGAWEGNQSPACLSVPKRTYLAQLYSLQVPYYAGALWGPYGWQPAGTVAGGYAYSAAVMARAQGDYSLLRARARIVRAEARRYEIENRLRLVDAYFKAKELNRAYRAKLRRPRPTPEEWAKHIEASKPDPLSPSELDPITGEIRWPLLLQTDRYANYRGQLEPLFAQRARSEQLSPATHFQIDRTTKALAEALKKQVARVPPMDYAAAKRFVRSLAYEVRRPPG